MEISREDYRRRLSAAIDAPADFARGRRTADERARKRSALALAPRR